MVISSLSQKERRVRERASNEKILSLDTQKNAERERDRKPNHGSKKSWFNAPLYKEREREKGKNKKGLSLQKMSGEMLCALCIPIERERMKI